MAGFGDFFSAAGSPFGNAAIGMGQSFFNNLRRKFWRGWNRENVYEPAAAAQESFYNNALQDVNRTYGNVVNQYQNRATTAGNQFYNPYASPYGGAVGPGIAGGAPGAKGSTVHSVQPFRDPQTGDIVTSVEVPNALAGQFSMGMIPNQGAGAVTPGPIMPQRVVNGKVLPADPVTRGEVRPGDMPVGPVAAATGPPLGQVAVDTYKAREGAVLNPYEQSVADISRAYDERTRQLVGKSQGLGAQQKADVDTYYNNAAARIKQDLIDAGLSDSSVSASMGLGNERERANEQRRLADQLRRDEIDLEAGLSGEALDYKGDAATKRGLFAQGVTGDTAAEIAAQGKEKRATDLGTSADAINAELSALSARTGLGEAQKNDIVNLLMAQLEGVPEYSAPLTGLQSGVQAHLNQEVTDSDPGFFDSSSLGSLGGLAALGIGSAVTPGSGLPANWLPWLIMGQGTGSLFGG